MFETNTETPKFPSGGDPLSVFETTSSPPDTPAVAEKVEVATLIVVCAGDVARTRGAAPELIDSLNGTTVRHDFPDPGSMPEGQPLLWQVPPEHTKPLLQVFPEQHV